MPGPASNTPNHAKSSSTSTTKSTSPSRTMTPTKGTPDSVTQTRSNKTSTSSPLSARGSVRRPGQAPRAESSRASEESKAETSALIEDLKQQLRKAETASEEYQKEAAVLQSRLDDALDDHTKLEESAQENVNRIEVLERERHDSMRKYRDLETAFEHDKVASMREKEEAMHREQELTDTVQRLKESLSNRDKRGSLDGESLLTRATSLRGRSSPRIEAGSESPPAAPRDSSQNNAKLILQKDKVIESLRLELAEAQIKLVELENAGGGHTQELEKMLLEARMSNAKLMEDNESYQVLLSEKTLNGDFGKSSLLDTNHRSESEPPKTPSLRPVSGSLADELDTANDNDDERSRKLEAELAAQRDQNKALTLYINKIITRLLQNETFEQLFENGSITGDNPLKHEPDSSPPKEKADTINAESAKREATADQNKENAAPTLLQRAGSIFGGKRQRPKSLMPGQQNSVVPEEKQAAPANVPLPSSPPPHAQQASATHLAIPNENPESAPSIPLRRSASGRGHARVPSMRSSHRRATSEWSGAATVVNNMNRSTSAGTGLSSPTGLASPRQTSGSFFPAQNPPPLILENTEPGDAETTIRSDVTSDSGYGESVMSKATSDAEAPSSPRAAAAAALEGKPLPAPPGHAPTLSRSDTQQSNEGKQTASGPSTWFSRDNAKAPESKPGMRPLRLVQEKAEADEAAAAERKKANRASFMGWFNKGQQGQAASPPQGPATLGSPPQFGTGSHSRQVSHDARPSSGGEVERSPPRI